VGNRRLLAPIRNGGKIIDIFQKLLVISHRKNHRRFVTGFVCQILECCTQEKDTTPKRGFCRVGSRKRCPELAQDNNLHEGIPNGDKFSSPGLRGTSYPGI